jgi:hypothetical protein
MQKLLANMEKNHYTRSFFVPGFIESGFDTTTPLTDKLRTLEK